jgi:hypothetical protein
LPALTVVAGGAVWVVVSSQLKAEHIAVAAVNPKDPGTFAGPLNAGAQAAAIMAHWLDAAGGCT